MDITSPSPPPPPGLPVPVVSGQYYQQQQQHQQQQQQQQPMEVQHKLLYVVQRCWHSGPKQYTSCDLLRLFHTQRESEEAAYHSAKAFHNASFGSSTTSSHHNNGDNNDTSARTSPKSSPYIGVKTLMLPSYPSNNNPQGSSYGFLAVGCLFWVRCLRATIVTASQQQYHQHQHQQNTVYNNSGAGSSICGTQAYAIVTEHVIGGTGNRNSRRGTEVCEGRVFGGDALARQVAMEAMAHVKATITTINHVEVQVQTVPIGKPNEFSYSTGDFLNDWPQEVILERPSLPKTNPMSMLMAGGNTNNNKRQSNNGVGVGNMDGSGGVYNDTLGRNNGSWDNTTGEEEIENVDYIVVDCPFEQQSVAKRRRTTENYTRTDDGTNSSSSNNNNGRMMDNFMGMIH
mmetsp:Transcript_13984/g.15170  ORF Transcript_13984/g.15170 Transcript_13984/m.15170 type:complete len:400 (-) Transcript_13984:262-1461(-)